MTNPLLAQWTGPFALPPFDQITDADFAPAFDAALAEAHAAIAGIAENPDMPSFDNTIVAMEQADQLLDRVAGVFYNLAGADSTPAREALQRDLAPRLSAHASQITNNRALFARIETLWNSRDALDLTPEELRVLMLYRRMFLRAGAALEGDARERLTDVKSQLAVLGTTFSQNLLADERAWSMPLEEDDLDGLPTFLIAAARDAAEARGLTGHVITLNRSLIVPFLQFSPRRDLRAQAFAAWVARGANNNAHDNRTIAAQTLALRSERAALLGYACFADYKLETEMAGTPQAVHDLLMQVWHPAKARAEADSRVLEKMLHADGINGAL